MSDELSGLHRSVHPNHFKGLTVSMEAFCAKRSEDYKLSVDCEEIWTARASFEYRTIALQRQSSGIWTIPRRNYYSLKLSVECDAVPAPNANPAHSLVDFSNCTKAERRDKARRLAAAANELSYSKVGRP